MTIPANPRAKYKTGAAANPAALAAFAQLTREFPKEPFRDRPRRPNGYRHMPEYTQWQRDYAAHEARLHAWHAEHIQLAEPAPDRLEIQVAGQPIPAFSAQLQPDGGIYIAPLPPTGREYPEQPSRLPTRPLELPGPKQSLDRFLTDNASRQSDPRRWRLETEISLSLERGQEEDYFNLHLRLPPTQELLYARTKEFLERLRGWLDYSRLARLTQLAGGLGSRPLTLLDYHLMTVAGPALEAAAAANPGAVAVWLYWWLEDWPEARPESMPLPRHPGMVIRAVREGCRELSPQAWKILAAMPAEQVKGALRRQRNGPQGIPYGSPSNWELLLWSVERIRQGEPARPARLQSGGPVPPPAAAIPEEIPGEPSAPPIPPQLTLLPPPPAALQETPPARPAARASRPRPPEYLPDPALTAELLRQRYAEATVVPARPERPPGREYYDQPRPPATPEARAQARLREQAMDRLTELALGHYAGQSLADVCGSAGERSRFLAALEDLADYCRAEPAAVLPKRTFPALQKAAHRWHQDALLRRLERELAEMEAEYAQEVAQAKAEGRELAPWTQPWTSPLPAFQAGPWQARLLATPQELFAESRVMQHCVGNGYYREQCAAGRLRIYHLQPAAPAAAVNPDPELAARRWGSTLELIDRNYGQAAAAGPLWAAGQHRGAMNSPPEPDAAAFAQALTAALNQAAAPPPKGRGRKAESPG